MYLNPEIAGEIVLNIDKVVDFEICIFDHQGILVGGENTAEIGASVDVSNVISSGYKLLVDQVAGTCDTHWVYIERVEDTKTLDIDMPRSLTTPLSHSGLVSIIPFDRADHPGVSTVWPAGIIRFGVCFDRDKSG